MCKTWFVTGTDTNVGKTYVACLLLRQWAREGLKVAGYKPVASGAEQRDGAWYNRDALSLLAAANIPYPYEAVNPYLFREETAPHLLSARQQRPIDLSVMSQGLHHMQQQADRVLVEGAGGWLVPLSEQHTFADWVQMEQLSVILVVAMRVGCINHALLSARAIQATGLTLSGWIANNVAAADQYSEPYRHSLQQWMPVPLLGSVPWQGDSIEGNYSLSGSARLNTSSLSLDSLSAKR
ncbi:MAG: dethiobiotin synthase [Enterobacteriaceae bacterium]